ncbi:MAG: iron ABC transporter permease [Planctomycetes bacterium]|nr:iron ABC transporter permease [Planctomycetota bacterium]
MRGRGATAILVLAGLLVVACVLAAGVGAVSIPPGRSVAILAHALGLGSPGDWLHHEEVILTTIRIPRVLVAVLAGGGLALSGAVMQGIFRNPMADPGVIGVSSGASLGSVIALYAGWAAASVLWLPATAFAGALLCSFLVYGIATSRGRTPVSTLLLAGIAVGGMAVSLTSLVLFLSLANYEVGRQMMLWLMGGLDGRGWLHVRLAAAPVLLGSAWLCLYARDLNVLLTGEESAMALGIDVPRTRRRLLVLSVLVTAATVSVAGVVSFVGLVVPHILRLVLGPDHRRLLPASFLGGALFLVLADLACRTMVESEELRLGVVTSLIGGPFFIYLLIQNRRRTETL